MKYIIMADGKGTRWQNYKDIPKHLIEIGGETLLGRTVRLLQEGDPSGQVIITSHDSRYEFPGAQRYEPKNNHLEIDRFTEELIEDQVCFLYGDTFYSESAMDTILSAKAEDILFFGNARSIVAVKVADGSLFRYHVDRVRQLFLEGKIEKCIGWQVYQSFIGLPFGEKRIGEKFTVLEDSTEDFNSPEDYNRRKSR
ncbi:MAG: NTP transferase domain-containing protein [Firmicutes bacterium]|nr:NTP transferase domain-containing protein [Bacillota bacterium]MDD7601447.1 NTP transferase domain-containing protein [Bacillota bacterium]MDY5857017.1 NTP transferase domain-containing protein [Anaerovoracaceae bacterium]